ncbi:MAG: glycosyltransferase [Porphyromonadaceae bacterium]|nr:glycosyltransferase [Porphyromonadaceae bacterium]
MKKFINNILLINGTYPPERCGVGDYCWNLINSTAGTKWDIFVSDDWRLKTLFKKIAQIKADKNRTVNIQYPSMGYKRSILPQLLCIYIRLFTSKEVSVTFHEFCQMSTKGKIAASIFILFTNKIIFTTEAEKSEVERFFPLLKKKRVKVIRIFSNIPISDKANQDIDSRHYDIVYFGYIRPKKGLEEFLTVCKKLKTSLPRLKVIIIGQVQEEFAEYAEKVLADIYQNHYKYEGELSETAVADTLADCKIAYLPYPDGISERRGTFLAALINKCIVVSKEGTHTTQSQRNICFLTPDTEAPELIKSILEKSISRNIEPTIEDIPTSWNDIKTQYENFLLL